MEEWNGELWGVTEVQTHGTLSPSELAELTDWLSGQFSDGWGEGLEQREIEVYDGELYVSFWEQEDELKGNKSFGFGMTMGGMSKSITDRSITHSFPSLSPPPAGTAAASPPERKETEAATQSAVEIYRDIIKENIEYDHLLRHSKIDREELDGIVELLVETVCTARKTIRVAGDDYPAELVKAKLLKLNSGHIEFVMDCMRENTTKIRNIKKYLLAVLFNAPSTMGSYYTTLVAHDMAEGKI